MDTLTETEYPDYLPIYCNVCSERISTDAEQDSNTILMVDMPIEVKVRLIDEAQRLRIPVEVAFQRFIEARYGRPLQPPTASFIVVASAYGNHSARRSPPRPGR